ncbi:hypothetical protein [Helicobacter typhlonius]|uniref:hypothetical protein n=1 Tax=Helicobacter typhlonius TaxID=76936 RepID=UPI00262A868F|nr:hypothetical protein [uncultured Helicobacter sp.]
MQDIFESIHTNDIQSLVDFIKNGQDINKTQTNITPLQYAVLLGNLGIILLLIECGARYDSGELITFAYENDQETIAEALKLII